MNIQPYIINDLLVIVVVFLLQLLLKNFVSSYFSEKGKNLAEKQDIKILTDKVESIKAKFTEQNELLKSELQFTKSIHGGLITEERNAIVNYVEIIFLWVNTAIDFGFDNINISNNKAIDDYIVYLSSFFFKSLNSDTKLRLFCTNDLLLQEAFDIRGLIIKNIGHAAINCLNELKEINNRRDETLAYKPIADIADNIFQEKIKFIKDSFNKVIPAYNEIVTACSKFRMNCKNHLYHLLKEQNL